MDKFRIFNVDIPDDPTLPERDAPIEKRKRDHPLVVAWQLISGAFMVFCFLFILLMVGVGATQNELNSGAGVEMFYGIAWLAGAITIIFMVSTVIDGCRWPRGR